MYFQAIHYFQLHTLYVGKIKMEVTLKFVCFGAKPSAAQEMPRHTHSLGELVLGEKGLMGSKVREYKKTYTDTHPSIHWESNTYHHSSCVQTKSTESTISHCVNYKTFKILWPSGLNYLWTLSYTTRTQICLS